MKLTKLFVAAAVLLAAAGAAFADEAKYNELLAKGKDYEAKKQWVYAMGTYWDAILEYPQGAKDANDGYKRIVAGFEKKGGFEGNDTLGNPGPGEYDIFSRYDGWINVCKEFEVYWNEHSDEIYYVPDVECEKGEADMKNRTMTYKFKGTLAFTPKFSTIWECIRYSFRIAHRDDWDDIPAQWPAVSMFKDSKTIPVVKFISACNDKAFESKTGRKYEVLIRSLKELYKYTVVGGGSSYSYSNDDEARVNFPPYERKTYYVAAWNNERAIKAPDTSLSNLEIKIKILDKNGRIIGSNDSSGSLSFEISGISSDDMKILDSGEWSYKVESIVIKSKNASAEMKKPISSLSYEKATFDSVKYTAGPVINMYRKGNNSNPLELYATEAKIAEIVSKGKLESDVLKPRKIDKNCYTHIENLQGDSVATNVEGVVFAIPLPSYESTKFKTKIDGLPVYCYDISVRITDDMSYMIDSFIDEMNRRYNADFQLGITSDGKYCIYRAITDAEKKAAEERIAAEKAAAEEHIAAEKAAEEEQRMAKLIANKIKNGKLVNAAFNGNKSLTSVIIPSGVTTIGDYAFNDCTSLINVTIPDSVTSIGSGAFGGCSSLKEIHFTGTKAHWMALYRTTVVVHCSDGDVNKNWYKSITDIVIPNGVTTIGNGAFRDCTSLTNVTIPDSVTTIGGGAFFGCRSLTSVTIPRSVKTIGHRAFWDCTSLKTVNYAGSKKDWKEIKINNEDKGNKPLLKAEIIYGKK